MIGAPSSVQVPIKIEVFLLLSRLRWLLFSAEKMYKALEAGYQMGLESLNENLSEVRAELVFAQRQLQFKPPLEELRAAYYRETKKFVSIPNWFEGFGNGKVRGPGSQTSRVLSCGKRC